MASGARLRPPQSRGFSTFNQQELAPLFGSERVVVVASLRQISPDLPQDRPTSPDLSRSRLISPQPPDLP